MSPEPIDLATAAPAMRAAATAGRLIDWYANHAHDWGLPWRRPGEPRWRAALAEGLLAQTTAAEVAAAYDRVFAGLTGAADWDALPEAERLERVAPLGLPRLKEGAVSAIAAALCGRNPWGPLSPHLTGYGCGPYIAGMVALLHGEEAAPVDVNVERVGGRADGDGDPARWITAVLGAAAGFLSGTGRAPGYEVISAVLDLGATVCRPGAALCERCPLAPHLCAASTEGRVRVQLQLFPSPRPPLLYHVHRVELGRWLIDLGWDSVPPRPLPDWVHEIMTAGSVADTGNPERLAALLAAELERRDQAFRWARVAPADGHEPDATAWSKADRKV